MVDIPLVFYILPLPLYRQKCLWDAGDAAHIFKCVPVDLDIRIYSIYDHKRTEVTLATSKLERNHIVIDLTSSVCSKFCPSWTNNPTPPPSNGILGFWQFRLGTKVGHATHPYPLKIWNFVILLVLNWGIKVEK